MDQDAVNEVLPYVTSLRAEAARWKRCPLAPDDLVNGFLIARADSIVRQFDPVRGPLWPFLRAGFWLYMCKAIATERRGMQRYPPASQITNGELGIFQFDLADPSGDIDPQARVLAEERTRAVNRALASLSEPEQQLVILRHFAGLQVAEITELLGLSTPIAAQKALQRARAKLKSQLQRYWDS